MFEDLVGLALMPEVAVLNNAKVRDLKQAVMKYVDFQEQSHLGQRHISWSVINLGLLDTICVVVRNSCPSDLVLNLASQQM